MPQVRTIRRKPLLGGSSETARRSPSTKKNVILAYIHGAIHDGSLNKGKRIRIAQKNIEWLEYIQKLFNDINISSWIYREGKTRNVYILETVTPKIMFGTRVVDLSTNAEKCAYIRGFFDAEGGIPHNGSIFYIQMVQMDRLELEQIADVLHSMGIETGKIHNPSKRVNPNYWRFFVRTKSHKDFAGIIGSWHPLKREIFRNRMMIQSDPYGDIGR